MKNERIVITGGAGFLGRYVRRELEKTVPHENILIPLFFDYDLTKETDVIRMYEDMRPTIVFHLACDFGGIGYNKANPGRTFHSNMAMGLHLVEQARLFKVKKFVQIGSVCAYPEHTSLPFSEDDLWSGYPEEDNAPYGIAKRTISAMIQYYRQQYNLNGISLLLTNLYGCCDDFNLKNGHVIPTIIRKFCNAKDEIVIWGNGSASRDFLYIEDAARGIVMAAENYDSSEPVNLATGIEITIEAIVEKIRSLSGFKGKVLWDNTKPEGMSRRCIDTTKARESFGFEAKTSFDNGLKRTFDFWKR